MKRASTNLKNESTQQCIMSNTIHTLKGNENTHLLGIVTDLGSTFTRRRKTSDCRKLVRHYPFENNISQQLSRRPCGHEFKKIARTFKET